MVKIFNLQIYDYMGLTNQIFSLLSTLNDYILTNPHDKDILLYGLNMDINHKTIMSWRNLFDWGSIRKLFPELNLYDGFFNHSQQCEYNIHKIYWGTDDKYIEIHADQNLLWEIIEKKKNILQLFSDPCPNELKSLKIIYENNDILKLSEYAGNITDISDLKISLHCTNPLLVEKFNEQLKDIQFDCSLKSNISYNNEKNISVIHLRNENDAIKHWSRMNRVNESLFQNMINDKYIHLIKKYIPIDSCIFILTSRSINNPVINQLYNLHYKNIHLLEKKSPYREWNAAEDICMAEHMMKNRFAENKILIAPANGSTFAHWLIKKLSWTEMIEFNLDKINHPENHHKK